MDEEVAVALRHAANQDAPGLLMVIGRVRLRYLARLGHWLGSV